MIIAAGPGRGVVKLAEVDPVAWAILIASVLVGWVLIPLAIRRLERWKASKQEPKS